MTHGRLTHDTSEMSTGDCQKTTISIILFKSVQFFLRLYNVG